MEDIETEYSGFYSPKEREFKEKVVPYLKEIKNNPRALEMAKEEGIHLGSSFWHEFLLVFFILALIVGITGFLYLGYTNHFKASFSDNSTINLNVQPANVTVPVENQYYQTTNNFMNITLINRVYLINSSQ